MLRIKLDVVVSTTINNPIGLTRNLVFVDLHNTRLSKVDNYGFRGFPNLTRINSHWFRNNTQVVDSSVSFVVFGSLIYLNLE